MIVNLTENLPLHNYFLPLHNPLMPGFVKLVPMLIHFLKTKPFIIKTLSMKKLLAFIIPSLLFISCKKNTGAPEPALLEHYPQKWILTVDDVDPDKYTVVFGLERRKSVLKSFSLADLASECRFEVAQSRSEHNNIACFSLRLDEDKRYWAGVVLSPNRQERHMSVTFASNNPDDDLGDTNKFLIHDMPKTNGVKTVVIESFAYPGYYISKNPPGFQYSPSQLTLETAIDPGHATHWQCR